MSELIPSTLFAQLKALAGFFVWKRKVRHDSIAQELRDACQRHLTLSQEHQKVLEEMLALKSNKVRLDMEVEETRKTIETKNRELSEFQAQYEKQVIEFEQLQEKHGDTWIRYDLVSRLLAAKPSENANLNRFHHLLENDFIAFAENVSMKTEAKALRIMQSIGKELEMLVDFSDVRKRNIVAIVGGFSSGKSAFINSFIDDPEIRLSVGIQPVTVIPSYVFAVEKREQIIRGYSANRGHIELDSGFYQGLSHAFINTFDFDLRGLMPFVCLGVKMNLTHFGHLCFIDTPGYNPSISAGYTDGDRNTSVEFAQQANALVWLIGLGATGTVPSSDIDFIHAIGHEKKPIYVVLNKADLRPQDDLEEIMDVVEDVLVNDEGFDILGICAYSSQQRRAFGYRRMELMDFFAKINHPSNVSINVRNRLDEVFDMYDQAIESDIEHIKINKTAMNALRLDAMEIGGEELLEKIADRVDMLEKNIKKEIDTDQLEKMLKQSKLLRKEFILAAGFEDY